MVQVDSMRSEGSKTAKQMVVLQPALALIWLLPERLGGAAACDHDVSEEGLRRE
jgi:hypothetical protein